MKTRESGTNCQFYHIQILINKRRVERIEKMCFFQSSQELGNKNPFSLGRGCAEETRYRYKR